MSRGQARMGSGPLARGMSLKFKSLPEWLLKESSSPSAGGGRKAVRDMVSDNEIDLSQRLVD